MKLKIGVHAKCIRRCCFSMHKLLTQGIDINFEGQHDSSRHEATCENIFFLMQWQPNLKAKAQIATQEIGNNALVGHQCKTYTTSLRHQSHRPITSGATDTYLHACGAAAQPQRLGQVRLEVVLVAAVPHVLHRRRHHHRRAERQLHANTRSQVKGQLFSESGSRVDYML